MRLTHSPPLNSSPWSTRLRHGSTGRELRKNRCRRQSVVAKKESRGLPPDFDLNIPIDKPVELGDYLDEDAAQSGNAAQRRVDAPAAAAWQQPPLPSNAVAASPSTPTPVAQQFPQPGYIATQQFRPAAVPRKQLNGTPETMRMLDELLMQIRQQSVEKDVRTSELFHAMVLCLYEARTYL